MKCVLSSVISVLLLGACAGRLPPPSSTAEGEGESGEGEGEGGEGEGGEGEEGEGEGGIACDPGFSFCGGACIHTDRNEDACGACDTPCDPGEACVESHCVALPTATELCEGGLFDEDGDGLVNCQDPDCASSCSGGAAVTGAPCTVNADCASDQDDPVCLSESLFGYFGGACSELCDPEAPSCTGDGVCVPVRIGASHAGLCFDACTTSSDCRAGYACTDHLVFGQTFITPPTCQPQSVCGDGIPSLLESCDGDNLRGLTCASFGMSETTGLACTDDCVLNLNGCATVCGDGMTGLGENCDGDLSVATRTCEEFGRLGGTVVGCNADCLTFDLSECADPVCGDGVILNGVEECDGASLGGHSCVTEGFTSGALACTSDCVLDRSRCENVFDEVEPNDTPGDANPFQGSFVGDIEPASDRDCMQVPAPAGSIITAATVALQEGEQCTSDTELFIFDSDGHTLLAYGDDDGLSVCSRAQAVVAASGDYSVCVQSWAHQYTLHYRLDVEVTPCSGAVCPNENGHLICADTMTSPVDCGGCGNVCPTGTCDSGACPSCDTVGLTDCVDDATQARVCADTTSDAAHCNDCSIACGVGAVCIDGACGCAAPAADACVDDGGHSFCTDVASDAANCGGCGNACGPGAACVDRTCVCTAERPDVCVDQGVTICTDLLTDEANCNACGSPCTRAGELCNFGSCKCGSGFLCPSSDGASDVCSDPASDPQNCGACGHVCGPGEGCAGAVCGVVVFHDDMESGVNGWTSELLSGAGQPFTQSHAHASSPTTSWASGPAPDATGDARLASPPIDLLDVVPGTHVLASFHHFYAWDSCFNFVQNGDGGIVEVSVDFGPFEQVNIVGGYDSAIPGDVNNPLRGRPAFTDTSFDTEHLNSVDLSEFAGESIRLGFHVGWDDGNCAPQEGWFIDDVVVITTD